MLEIKVSTIKVSFEIISIFLMASLYVVEYSNIVFNILPPSKGNIGNKFISKRHKFMYAI